jgi:hypothetical protein
MSDEDAKTIERMRIALALRALSPMLQTAVLDDPTITSQLGIPVARRIKLVPGLLVDQTKLLDAVREATSGKDVAVTVEHNGQDVEAYVSIQTEGAARVRYAGQTLLCGHALLLADEVARRETYLESVLASCTLSTRSMRQARELVAKPRVSNDDFRELTDLLGSSLEEFARQLKHQAETTGALKECDFLPRDSRHWEHIAGSRKESVTLRNFVEQDLAQERRLRLTSSSRQAFLTLSLSFASPELVPHALLDEWEAQDVLKMIEDVVDCDDHFSLVGAFEICAHRLLQDARFAALGERILERLIGDMARLEALCAVFAASFVLATARLAISEATYDQPVFWRRLAAAGHASLVVRALGVADLEAEDAPHKVLFPWALNQRRDEYFLSAYADMAVEPRWRPDWIAPRMLVADAFGRIAAAIHPLAPDMLPEGWQMRITHARSWIDDRHLGVFGQFPAILQGARVTDTPELDAESEAHAQEHWQRLQDVPSIENLLRAEAAVAILGPRRDAALGILKAVRGIDVALIEDPGDLRHALAFAAHFAALTQDAQLGGAVVERCFDWVRAAGERPTVHEIVDRLVTCAGAEADPVTAKDTLVEWLEALAFILPAGPRAKTLVEVLQNGHRVLRHIALGRALHAARLAISRRRPG